MENTPLVTRSEAWASAAISLFFVVFLWGFWDKGPFALGWNFTIFLGALTLLFVSKLPRGGRYETRDLAWIAPLLLTALSFSLYENPFFKIFALLVFPASLAVFYACSWVDDKRTIDWDAHFLTKIAGRLLSVLLSIRWLFLFAQGSIFNKDDSRLGMLKRIGFGLAVLAAALLVIVPMLSSADPMFAERLKPVYDLVAGMFSPEIVGKLAVFAVIAAGAAISLHAWGRPHAIESAEGEKERDLVVTGIVLGGIFLVYLVFLWVQLDRLWVGALPIEFAETEGLVKSGFWQLLLLTFVNIAIFFSLYRRTALAGQRLLGAFSAASMLLLVSSAQRMWLYVTYYGFSYEKFYASYAVLFCAVLFVWLISRLFVAKRANTVRFLAFQFLWMFAFVSIFPVEQFILRSNMALVRNEGSHIRLYEMSMLSADVLPEIREYRAKGLLTEKAGAPGAEARDWNAWIEERESDVDGRGWYELNLGAVRANRR